MKLSDDKFRESLKKQIKEAANDSKSFLLQYSATAELLCSNSSTDFLQHSNDTPSGTSSDFAL